MNWYRVREFNTRNFSVILDCEPEQSPDLSWMDTEVKDKVESGQWHCVTFRVRVIYRGHELATQYLGNSVYEDVRDFGREHIGIRPYGRLLGAKCGSYYADMVRTAVAAARKAVRDMPRLRNRVPL